MITKELKEKVLSELAKARENFGGSDAKFAVSIGINNAQYSRIKNGETERVLSDANWISIARNLGVNISEKAEWKTANTPVFQFITAQLELCQKNGVSSLLCDISDMGKTYTAQYYAKTHKNIVYVDCGQVKSKQKLIRFIAKSFGVGSTGRYADVYEDLVFYIKTLPIPLIILDEAGDLQYDAFLELKSLWNRTEHACGFYMMGADGLKERIRRSIDCKKVGFTELFSRFGKCYQTAFVKLNKSGDVVRMSGDEQLAMLRSTAAMIIKANTNGDVNRILNKTLGDDGTPSLRRIYTEITKQD
jgi:DNA transposition AAA+ family ATPase